MNVTATHAWTEQRVMTRSSITRVTARTGTRGRGVTPMWTGAALTPAWTRRPVSRLTTPTPACVVQAGPAKCVTWRWFHAAMLQSARQWPRTTSATTELVKTSGTATAATVRTVIPEATARMRSTSVRRHLVRMEPLARILLAHTHASALRGSRARIASSMLMTVSRIRARTAEHAMTLSISSAVLVLQVCMMLCFKSTETYCVNQARDLEARGSNPGPGSNFSLEFKLYFSGDKLQVCICLLILK